jgi:hypothetical protein
LAKLEELLSQYGSAFRACAPSLQKELDWASAGEVWFCAHSRCCMISTIMRARIDREGGDGT